VATQGRAADGGAVMKIGDYDTHPIADAFPLLQGEDFERFKQGIKDRGLRDPRVPLFEGKLLDARNRYRACLELGAAWVKKLKFFDVDGDPFVYVLDHNINDRRHLNESQRAIAICRLVTMKPGRPRKNRPRAELSAADGAKAAGVGERTMERAKAVLGSAVQEVIAAIDAGEMSLREAEDIAKLPDDQQRDALQRRKERVQRANSKERPVQGYGMDAIEAMRTVIMRAVHEAGGLVKARADSDGLVLEVGYRGQGVTITLERIEAS
jgi:hypothetical protein